LLVIRRYHLNQHKATMKKAKILFVDDETVALKYFDKLVSPIAPVLVAASVEQGKEILRQHGDEISVLISDQRMPGAHGNELLRYAREYHPHVIRMLTTAYSEIGEAVEAINSGEIYRYITKPWDMHKLHADLRNALELSGLRQERDLLLREKLGTQRQIILTHRCSQLAILCAGFCGPDYRIAMRGYMQVAAAATGAQLTGVGKTHDHPLFVQHETDRYLAAGPLLAHAFDECSSLSRNFDPHETLLRLSGDFEPATQGVVTQDARAIASLLLAEHGDAFIRRDVLLLAWLLFYNKPIAFAPAEEGTGWRLHLKDAAADTDNTDWLLDGVAVLAA
jgi:two-component system probable response regulator PhcQ